MDRSSFYDQYSALKLYLKEALSLIKPLEDDVATRTFIIEEFRAVVNSVESLRGATVEPFGSFISQLYSRWGDLDISVEVSFGSSVPSIGKIQKQNLLKDIRKALQKGGIARRVQFIPSARVPLLIFESNHKNISCDISINNQLGYIKSKLLFRINEIDERFRDMVLLVKEWAKSQNINNPKTGTLNSYSLSMLVIFHFQTCEPAILPPLSELYPGNIVEDLRGVRAISERIIEDTCVANIAKFRAKSSRNVNRCSLAELFTSFFQKFSGLNMRASQHVICPYTGNWEPIMNNVSKIYPLLIEDPFEQPENAARAVSRNALMRISETFEETHHKLSRNQDQRSLISTLVRPQLRQQYFARTQGNYQNVHDGGIRRHTQLSSPVRPMRQPINSKQAHQRQQFSNQVWPTRSEIRRVQFGTHPSPTSFSEGSSSSSGVNQFENQFKNMALDGHPSHKNFPQRRRQMVNGHGNDASRWIPK